MVMFSSRAPQSAVVGWALACLDSDNQGSKSESVKGNRSHTNPWSYPQISISKAKNNNERRGRFRHGMETPRGPVCHSRFDFCLGFRRRRLSRMCNDAMMACAMACTESQSYDKFNAPFKDQDRVPHAHVYDSTFRQPRSHSADAQAHPLPPAQWNP